VAIPVSDCVVKGGQGPPSPKRISTTKYHTLHVALKQTS